MSCVMGRAGVIGMRCAESCEDAMLMRKGEWCRTACVEERRGGWRRPRWKKSVQNQSPRRLQRRRAVRSARLSTRLQGFKEALTDLS